MISDSGQFTEETVPQESRMSEAHDRSAGADPLALGRDRFLAGDAFAVCSHAVLSGAGGQIAITALFALSLDLILGFCGIVSLGHAAFFGIGAYTAGLLSKWGFGEPLSGLVTCRACGRHIRLSDELHHRALPASRLDHAHAGACAAAAGDRQQRQLAHRRL